MSQIRTPSLARGFFAIGAERISKSLNLGNLMRSAHGFGASFTFTIGAAYKGLEAFADTSKSRQHLPHYDWASPAEVSLPQGCTLVGVELTEDAVELPSFRHPLRAAYVLGPEKGALSAALLAQCSHVVRIPTRFSINLAMAGAIVMYDRIALCGRFPPRPLSAREARRLEGRDGATRRCGLAAGRHAGEFSGKY